MNRLTVALADDHNLVRAGLRKLLESMETMEVVGEAADGSALLAMVDELRPQLVLMDISMPGMNGLEAMAKLSKSWPDVRVLILSMHETEEYVRQALFHGAAGYLLKDSATNELDLAIKSVMQGKIYLSPGVSGAVLNDYVQRLRSDEPAANVLTPRQREVLTLIAEGQSTKQIARTLDLSVKTVETHRSQLMRQIDVHEVAGLVRFAMRNGLVS